MADQPKVGPSGVRKYAKHNLRHAVRRWWTTRGLASRGEGVYVDHNVQIQRHPENVRLGARVMLKEGARLCPTNPTATLEIGENTTVGHHTFIFAMNSITIGKNCLIAPFCYLIDNQHGVEAGRLIREQAMSAHPILLEEGVWLGTGVVVTSGVTIGAGAVIGARSVVTSDIPANAIAVGVPARVIKMRGEA